MLFLAAPLGWASAIVFTGLPLNHQYGTYNGFAFATVDWQTNQLLICDDYNHDTLVPSGPLLYSLSTLTGSDPLEFARFVDPTHWEATIFRYEEAAVLLNGLSHTGPGLLMDLTADYQYALWHLFTPSAGLPNSTAQTLLDEAAFNVQHAGSSNDWLYADLRIYTPITQFESNQEFLQLVANPEPSPMVLVAIGIGAIALSVWMRRRLPTLRRARAAPPKREP